MVYKIIMMMMLFVVVIEVGDDDDDVVDDNNTNLRTWHVMRYDDHLIKKAKKL